MPPRSKQTAKQQPADKPSKKMGARSRTRSANNNAINNDSDAENITPPPPKNQTKSPAPAKKQSNRNRSRDTSKLDESMKSVKSASAQPEPVSAAVLQAQQELEIQQMFGNITSEILCNGPEATAVTNVMKRNLVASMRRVPRLFQKTLLAFIERLITIEAADAHLKNFHLLLTRVFHEFVQERDHENGAKLIKSVIRYLLDVYHLPKLQKRLQEKTGHFLALTINACAQKEVHDASDLQSKEIKDQAGQSNKTRRTFTLLNDARTKEDQEMVKLLEETVVEMLSPTVVTSFVQADGIQIASLLSNYKDDPLFLSLMKLLMMSTSQRIRETIIKSIKAPYSDAALAFLGKRLRDKKPAVVKLIFDQLVSNGVTISQFPGPEARMLVLTEGFTSHEPIVREACIKFLTPTVQEYADKNDIAGLLKLIEARLAFGNEYYGRIPGYVTLAILEILEQDVTLANYLEKVVIRKLRQLAGIPLNKKKTQKSVANYDGDREIDEMDLFGEAENKNNNGQEDVDMVSKDSDQPIEKFRESQGNVDLKEENMEVDEQVLGPISFEEILLLRLAFELNKSTAFKRSQFYLDRLEEIVPEFDDYRKITFALANMTESDLPFINPKDDKQCCPYPKGQVGFSRRAILGEWMKFSLQMNISDEIIRNSLTTLCFELICKIDYSYDDYEHLLKKQTQLLKGDDQGNVPAIVQASMGAADDDQDINVEDLLAQDNKGNLRHSITEYQQDENENQQVEITIRNFENIGIARPLQEYCKPFSMETLTLDFDDVCQMAVTVAKTLLGDRADEFQLKVMEAISDIKETVQDDGSGQDAFSAHKQGMFFSQIPQQQQQEIGTICFPALRAKFTKKIEQKVEDLHSLGAEESEFEIEAFNKTFRQLQIYVQLVEETYLKEKLSYKRALILCRTLLKQCRLSNVNDQNVIAICETIVHPCVLNLTDKENLLLAFECIGLICILDKSVFLNYSKIFTEILDDEIDPEKDNKREKVIAIKSVVDGLIIHGISEPQLDTFFEILTKKYLTVKDRILRQVSIEGVCKMLFTPRLCDQNDQKRIEAILAQLLLLFFDHEYSPKNSLVTSILNEFFKNFAPYSEQRCYMLLNAMTKVVYACMRERYGLDKKSMNSSFTSNKPGQNGKKQPAKKNKKKIDYSDSEDEAFDISEVDYASDDSLLKEQKVSMRQICKSVSLVQILSRCIILSRVYINESAIGGFRLRNELTVVLFQRLLRMNNKLFKKTAIVKEVLLAVLDVIRVESSDSLKQLRQVEKQWAKNAKMLITTTQKVSQFQDRLNQRIQELEEIEDANQQVNSVPQNSKDQDVDMNRDSDAQGQENDSDDGSKEDSFGLQDLTLYWEMHIEDVLVDRGKYDDRELLEMQQIWLDQLIAAGIDSASSKSKMLSNSAKKSILKSPSNFKMRLGRDQEPASNDKPQKKNFRPKRGTRAQNVAQGGSANLTGKVKGLEPIAEAKAGSANPRQRRVRIVEEQKEVQSSRLARVTRGTVKSEISEYDDEDESSSEEMLSSSNYGGQSSSSKMQHSTPDKAGQAGTIEAHDSEASQQMHTDLVNDNLGAIAKNIANNFAKSSKRLSVGSNQPKINNNVSVKLSASPSSQKEKLFKQEVQSADKSSQDAAEHERRKVFFGDKDLVKESESAKKKLVRDFDVASQNSADVAKPKPRSGVLTRKRQKSQSSAHSRSQSSNADDDSEDDGMFDFMDGKRTKQLKQQKLQKRQAAAVKKTPLVVKQEPASTSALNESKASIMSTRSTRARKRQTKE